MNEASRLYSNQRLHTDSTFAQHVPTLDKVVLAPAIVLAPDVSTADTDVRLRSRKKKRIVWAILSLEVSKLAQGARSRHVSGPLVKS